MSEKNYAVMDGNTAAAYASYAFTEVAAIFPITPSSPMAEKVDEWAAVGKKNIFGNTVNVIEMQSEGGAAGTCHGSLQAGALTTTYTAAQGLLLMIPPMYKIAGEFLPGVFHVAARTLSQHALSIFGDHSDVMACRQTGAGMIFSSSPQEAMDLGAVSHLSAIGARYAFIHVFDGFRTSHEMQRIEALDYDELAKLVDYDQLYAFRNRGLNPEHPATRGTTVNPDIFFQCREAANTRIASVPGVVEKYMHAINKLTGRDYELFNYYGAKDADKVIIIMGSGAETLKDTVDYLTAKGEKVGMIQVHLYRPFSLEHFIAAVPESCRKIAVLDRTKESGGIGEPLYLDVITALSQAGRTGIKVVGGRYGLSSKDVLPGDFVAVYENLGKDEPKNNFTISIVDDVTGTSLERADVSIPHPGMTECKIWGIGGDGTVGANKNAITTIGLTAGKYAQAYFSYDSMKSGGLTQSHLRFGDEPIRQTYSVSEADYVACHVPSYIGKYDMTADLKEGGIFLLNTRWDNAEDLGRHLPGKMKRDLAEKHARFYVVDANKEAEKVGLGGRINTILQAAFFQLTQVIPIDVAVKEMKELNYKSYFKKAGQDVVDKNNAAVDAGLTAFKEIKVPAEWADCKDDPEPTSDNPFVNDIVIPMDRQKGWDIPISTFMKYGCEDGTWPNGVTKYMKRGVATQIPAWDPAACLQCNRCVVSCPHAAIRPLLLTDEEKALAGADFDTVKGKGPGFDKYNFRIQLSPMDCMGCGVCITQCPKAGEALRMVPTPEDRQTQQKYFDSFCMDDKYLKRELINSRTFKNLALAKPYFEFSAACAGCAESAYIGNVSRLVGDRMYIANASGCSSAYGGAMPTTPYCTDCKGRGPAWEQSLFEDNAEFAFGFWAAHDAVHREIMQHCEALKTAGVAAAEAEAYMNGWKDPEKSRAVSDALIDALKDVKGSEDADFIMKNTSYLVKKSIWAFGGDGWAYDIGYGGLDHVIAQNKDVNILVMDTEVYSNTGGQSSKATPAAAIAKFAAAGKEIRKKDLGSMAMTYGYVYVAQVAIGADQTQFLRALREAESYDGPSVIICYCPCLEHGIRTGMSSTQQEMKKAVECGYWQLYRYDPRLAAEGKNPFQLDSREPDFSKMTDFMKGENRYRALSNAFPEKAEKLYAKAVRDAQDRYAKYRKLAEN